MAKIRSLSWVEFMTEVTDDGAVALTHEHGPNGTSPDDQKFKGGLRGLAAARAAEDWDAINKLYLAAKRISWQAFHDRAEDFFNHHAYEMELEWCLHAGAVWLAIVGRPGSKPPVDPKRYPRLKAEMVLGIIPATVISPLPVADAAYLAKRWKW